MIPVRFRSVPSIKKGWQTSDTREKHGISPWPIQPVTKEAVEQYFSNSKFKKGPVLPIPLFSAEGSMDAAIVMMQKRE